MAQFALGVTPIVAGVGQILGCECASQREWGAMRSIFGLVVDAEDTCEGELTLLEDAPEPISSSEPSP